MNDGYILLHRSILNWEWYKDLKTKMLFLYCLLRANWKPAEYRGHHIDRGQFVSTLENLSADTGLSVGEVRTALKHLTSTGELTSGMKGKYRVITVNNYDHYQNINSFSTDRRQADSSSLAAIEKEEKEKECLSVSSTDVSDTDRQPRLPSGADMLPGTAPDPDGFCRLRKKNSGLVSTRCPCIRIIRLTLRCYTVSFTLRSRHPRECTGRTESAHIRSACRSVRRIHWH